MKKAHNVIIVIILTIFLIEVLSGTVGGIHVLEFSDDIPAYTFFESEEYPTISQSVSEIVFTTEINQSVWTIGIEGGGDKKQIKTEVKRELNRILEFDISEDDFEEVYIKRIELSVPYIGGWKKKYYINALEEKGIVEHDIWMPFAFSLK